ncbi:MAG: OprO/OprP family phosphate-selective porin [Prolixibacteraceae bacterium]|nr:OprO/OprP family phosphate-selective porin [Prolixibacteraceae bacterium]
MNEQLNGLLERVATNESDLSKLTKIKISGYMQAQYQKFESPALLPTSNNYFALRRVRVKFTYEATDGVKFVLQPDFAPGALALKDAYVILNDRWTKAFSITMGKFNRPNYEVEYSSSQRELPERSSVIRAIYPGERAIGAKLEFNPQNTPIHMQLAVFNGSEDLKINNSAGSNLNSNENKDYDNFKDVMARVTYNLRLGNFGGLDFGAHGYFGKLKSMATTTYLSDYTTVKSANIGDGIARSWGGAEFQLFADVLGGLSVKGEYIAGKNASIGFTPSGTTLGVANFQNKFAGYYLYFIKNLGKKNQFALRYDYYDPNTDIKDKDIAISGYAATATLAKKMSGKSDLATSTLGLAFHHYFDDNLRITLAYDIVQNEKVGTSGKVVDNYTTAAGVAGTMDWSNAINQNVMTLRIQAKF